MIKELKESEDFREFEIDAFEVNDRDLKLILL